MVNFNDQSRDAFLTKYGIKELETHIKEFNIIENHQNLSCKIVDFGLARVLSEDECAVTYGGTKPYMAPEIHLGLEYNHKVDVWSIGCTFYKLITGFLPFMGEDLKLISNINEGFYFIPMTIKLSY
jgi:hypothetical protein